MTTAKMIGLLLGLLGLIAFPDSSGARPLGETGGRNHGSRIAAGVSGNHTCAVKEDGTVRCWGSNASGQLGNGTGGTGQFSATPVQVSNLTDAVALAAGTSHSCALRATGGVVCWGANGSGRLGDGTTATRFAPVAVLNPDGTALSGVVGITAGLVHTCAVKVDGTLRCWGSNISGKLGNGNTNVTSSAFALTVTNLSDAISVAAGFDHTCAARVNGMVKCWGANVFGQLGIGSTDSTNHSTPVDVPNSDLSVGVAAGSNHTCAVRANGSVRCWGFNAFGQIGNGTTGGEQPSPALVDSLVGVAVLALGRDHSCARRADGDIRCWGRNESRQLGDGTTTNRPTQVTVADHFTATPTTGFTPTPVLNAEGLAAGERHSCSLQVDDKVLCWGANDLGQLGNTNTPVFPSVASLVSGTGGTIGGRFVSAGVDKTCARRADASAACWGSNLSPATVTGFTRTLAVATGLSHKCALQSDGLVRCVGSNQQGQIGNGNGGAGAPDVTDPVQGQVSGLSDVAAVAAGNGFTCALRVTGSVRCWGANDRGQLGNGVSGFLSGRFEPSPVVVVNADGSTLSDIVALAAGRQHACAIRVGGTVHCWGANGFGEVGASVANTSIGNAFQVSGITNAVAIAAGPEHSCALLVNGRAKCWGLNDVGQLGNNHVSDIPTTPHPTPDDVENLTDAVALAAGGSAGPGTSTSRDFTCARRAGGTVRCWGDNAFGQLGDNSTTDHLQPETSVLRNFSGHIASLSGVTAITAGNLFGCALLASGQPFCWGSGSSIALPVSSFAFNIDPNVTLTGHDRVARVTVLANCPEGQQAHIEVQLTQGGVFGQGHAVGQCTGGLTKYAVTVPARGRTRFEPGPAEVQADAVILHHGTAVDTQAWTRKVNLVFEP